MNKPKTWVQNEGITMTSIVLMIGLFILAPLGIKLGIFLILLGWTGYGYKLWKEHKKMYG